MDGAARQRRVLVEPRRGVSIEMAEARRLEVGEVRVRTVLAGICGSDLHALAGEHPFLSAPYTPGHEAVGVVDALHESVVDLEIGDRVLLKPSIPCGSCDNCGAGRTNACRRLTWVGCDTTGHWRGAMGDVFVAPAHNLLRLPDGLDDTAAALVECLATPVHAVRLAGSLAGSRVVVQGAGTIGLLCVVLAHAQGAELVVVTDLSEPKLHRAVAAGADLAVRADLPSSVEDVADAVGDADVVFDCVSTQSTVRSGLACLRPAGSLLIVGVPPQAVELDVPSIQEYELRVQGCASYTEPDFEAALALAARGLVTSDAIVSAVFDLDDAERAFDAAHQVDSGKVLVRVG